MERSTISWKLQAVDDNPPVKVFDNSRSKYRRVTTGERVEFSPALFQNFKKVPWFWKKNALTLFIYVLNFSFKMLF